MPQSFSFSCITVLVSINVAKYHVTMLPTLDNVTSTQFHFDIHILWISVGFYVSAQVIEAAKQRPEIVVQVGLEYRYMPPVAKLIDIVKSGTLGQVRMVAIREHRFPFLVKVLLAVFLPAIHTSPLIVFRCYNLQVNNWNRFNCNSGGTLVEKCCHFFDLMILFAAANPVRVMASGAIDVNHKNEVYDGQVWLSHCLIKTFHWMHILRMHSSVLMLMQHAIFNKDVLFRLSFYWKTCDRCNSESLSAYI